MSQDQKLTSIDMHKGTPTKTDDT